jgi:hypothetical protein
MSLLSEVERGTATGGAFDSPVLKPGTFYQPALQAGLKCDGGGQKRMRFPEVPFRRVAWLMDNGRLWAFDRLTSGRFGR